MLAVAVGLPLAACGGGGSDQGGGEAQLNVAPIEENLRSALQPSSTSGGAPTPRVQQVNCPQSVAAKAGSTFQCNVSGTDGLAGTVLVRLKDARGESFSYKGNLKGNGFTQRVSGTSSTR